MIRIELWQLHHNEKKTFGKIDRYTKIVDVFELDNQYLW